MKLEFDVDDLGNQVIVGRKFEKCQFSDLVISPPLSSRVRIENCEFLKCSTSPGTCRIRSGVTLDHVTFRDLDCGDALRISSEVDFNEVTIQGKRPKALIIEPQNDKTFKIPEIKPVEFQVDISDYLGEVTILGMRSKMVRKDPNRHVSIHEKWRDEVDWKSLGMGPLSYWRMVVKRLSLFHAEEGIFSLPSPKEKRYSETMKERDILVKAGVQFN